MIKGKCRILVNTLMILMGISFLFPMYWMLNISFKTKSEVYNNPFGLPEQWVFNNYGDALEKFNFPRYLANSVIYSVGTIIITVFSEVCSLTASAEWIGNVKTWR